MLSVYLSDHLAPGVELAEALMFQTPVLTK